jgi:hypothetical protein
MKCINATKLRRKSGVWGTQARGGVRFQTLGYPTALHRLSKLVR